MDEEERPIQKGTLHGNAVGFRLLPSGSYRLFITGANISSQLVPLELKAQETLAVEIELR